MSASTPDRSRLDGRPWRRAIVPAGVIATGVAALFVYWFGVADRYAVFLYDHLGATPFDQTTGSRYWMCGLVAGGIVLALYMPLQALLGWRAHVMRLRYVVPDPVRVWTLAVAPLALGIPIITMTMNAPTLPLGRALGCTVSAGAALALAVAPSRWAAERPVDLLWLAADGLGLAPVLLLLRVLELPPRGIYAPPLARMIAAGALIASVAWLALMTVLRAWRRRPRPGVAALVASGLAFSYLVLPLAHHLLATPPGYRYISTSSNFFPLTASLTAASLATAVLLAILANAARPPHMRAQSSARRGEPDSTPAPSAPPSAR